MDAVKLICEMARDRRDRLAVAEKTSETPESVKRAFEMLGVVKSSQVKGKPDEQNQ